MSKQVFVSPYKEEWKVKVVGNQKASAICETRAEAIGRAKEIAHNNGLELIVQKRNGQIGLKNSYGNDPIESKG